MCGKQLSTEAFSTIGEQRKYNYALQPMSREEFKRLVTVDQAEAPDYFVHDAILNRQDRQSLETAMRDSLKPLELAEAVKLQQAGTQVVDVREAIDFEGAHLAGSINIGLKGKYATWCGTILDKEKPIIVLADEGDEEEAIMRLGRIGFDLVQGYVAGGPKALEQHPELMATTHRITSQALAEELENRAMLTIVDVRAEKEWQAGHIEGSVNLPLNHLAERANELPSDKTLVVHCKSGYRSAIAASILQQHGFEHVFDLVGGFDAWNASKLPSTEPAATSCQL